MTKDKISNDDHFWFWTDDGRHEIVFRVRAVSAHMPVYLLDLFIFGWCHLLKK